MSLSSNLATVVPLHGGNLGVMIRCFQINIKHLNSGWSEPSSWMYLHVYFYFDSQRTIRIVLGVKHLHQFCNFSNTGKIRHMQLKFDNLFIFFIFFFFCLVFIICLFSNSPLFHFKKSYKLNLPDLDYFVPSSFRSSLEFQTTVFILERIQTIYINICRVLWS